jgi:hypothetical protein
LQVSAGNWEVDLGYIMFEHMEVRSASLLVIFAGSGLGIFLVLILCMLVMMQKKHISYRVRVMVFNATFNNISVISRWSVLLVEETGVPGKKNSDLSQVYQL